MSDLSKITEVQRRRRAVVYVRQSTLHQVERNTESAARQYALRARAVEHGWPAEAVTVVDEDTGRSGSSTDGRLGFKELVAEVGLGHVGIVLALDPRAELAHRPAIQGRPRHAALGCRRGRAAGVAPEQPLAPALHRRQGSPRQVQPRQGRRRAQGPHRVLAHPRPPGEAGWVSRRPGL